MGVTLERVQNKFACIIGELCSEPDILSQFAIWVDLRIAEYKAKGAISLECTGDDPNPNWLRGHKKSILKGKLRGMPCQTEPLHHTESYREESAQEADERLSPDIVIVKNEPDTDIFPVNVHINANSSVNAVSSSRKRSSTDFYPREHSDLTSQSHCKVQRLSPSPNVLEPMNQSLMSIISQCELLDESGDVSGSTDPAQDSSCVTDMGDNSICMPSTSTDSAEHPDNNRTAVKVRSSVSSKRYPKLKQPRQKVYKAYSTAVLEEALKAVQEGKLSQRHASRVYKIPQQTIGLHLRKIKLKLIEAMKIKDFPTQTV